MIRFLRFAVAGTGGFVVQIGLVAVLTTVLNVNYVMATLVAVEAAILVNFAWHENWTWNDRQRTTSAIHRLIRFNALNAITSIFGSIFLTVFLVEVAGLPVVAANIASIALLSLTNFIGADRLVFRAGAVLIVIGLASNAFANDEAMLQAKTVRDFAKYVAAVEARSTASLAANEPFLQIERQSPAELARTIAALKRGEIIVSRAAARAENSSEIEIDGGLINHWRGTVFVPNVKLDHLLRVLQEPQIDQHKQEDVLSSRVLSRNGDTQKVFLRLRRTKFVTVVYDTEYDVEYKRLAADRALSNSISTKVVEIENAGTPRERALPEGNDHGYMWRLNSYWRYKQLDDGVLVEVESLTLSRNLPAIIGPLIRPIVSSTARESMSRTLASVRARFAH